MPLKHIGKENFKIWAEEKIEAKKQSVIYLMEDIGNGCVGVMRDNQRKRYTDRTNNLRSSTGYVVVADGNIIENSGFECEGNGKEGDGSKGSAEGKSYSKELSSTIKDSETALILVAGMEYAGYVEAKGLDVLSSAKLQAKSEIKRRLKELTDEW